MSTISFISVSEAANIAGVSNETIRGLCKAGTIRYQKRAQLYYPCKEDINRYVDSISKVHSIRKDIERYASQLEKDKEAIAQKCAEYKAYFEEMKMSAYRLDRLMEIAQAILKQYETYPPEDLSKRELQLLFMMFKGEPVQQVGEQLQLTGMRVRQIWKKVLSKMEVVQNEITRRDKEIESLRGFIIQIQKEREKKKYELLPKELQDKADLLLTPISALNFSVRSIQGLATANIFTVLELVQCKRNDIRSIRNFGAKSVKEIDQWLNAHKLTFEMTTGFTEEDVIMLQKDKEAKYK